MVRGGCGRVVVDPRELDRHVAIVLLDKRIAELRAVLAELGSVSGAVAGTAVEAALREVWTSRWNVAAGAERRSLVCDGDIDAGNRRKPVSGSISMQTPE